MLRSTDGPVPGCARRRATAQVASPNLVTPSLRHDLHTIFNDFCANTTADTGVPCLSDNALSELVSASATQEERDAASQAGNKLMRALYEYTLSQQLSQQRQVTGGDTTEQVPSLHTDTAETYSIQHRDTATIIATVKGGLAERNEMVPIFAKLLKNSTHNQCITEVYHKMHGELKGKGSDQIPVLTSTLTKKLCLRKIFQSSSTLEPHRNPNRSQRGLNHLLNCIIPHTAAK